MAGVDWIPCLSSFVERNLSVKNYLSYIKSRTDHYEDFLYLKIMVAIDLIPCLSPFIDWNLSLLNVSV